MFIQRFTWLRLLMLQIVLFSLALALPFLDQAITDTWPPDEQGPHSLIHAVFPVTLFLSLFVGFISALLIPVIIVVFCGRNDPPPVLTPYLVGPHSPSHIPTNYERLSPFFYILAFSLPGICVCLLFSFERCAASPELIEIVSLLTVVVIAASLLFFLYNEAHLGSGLGCLGAMIVPFFLGIMLSYTPLKLDTEEDTPPPNPPAEMHEGTAPAAPPLTPSRAESPISN